MLLTEYFTLCSPLTFYSVVSSVIKIINIIPWPHNYIVLIIVRKYSGESKLLPPPFVTINHYYISRSLLYPEFFRSKKNNTFTNSRIFFCAVPKTSTLLVPFFSLFFRIFFPRQSTYLSFPMENVIYYFRHY